MTDAELIRAVQAGDQIALEALWQRYLPIVWRYACARLDGDVHAAEDVVSETFLATLRRIRSPDPGIQSVGRWLIGIARHKVIDCHRQRAQASAPAGDGQGNEARSNLSARSEGADMRAAVADVLEQMPDEERIVLEWKYLDCLSVRDIAARLGRTEKAAETVLYRARKSFREHYRRHDSAG